MLYMPVKRIDPKSRQLNLRCESDIFDLIERVRLKLEKSTGLEVSGAQVIRLAIRALAKQEGILKEK